MEQVVIIEAKKQTEVDCLIAILGLGLCAALEHQALSVSIAEDYLFTPYTMELLETVKASQEAIDLVHLGTELGSVERIIPQHFQESLDEMKLIAFSILEAQSNLPEPRPRWLRLIKPEMP